MVNSSVQNVALSKVSSLVVVRFSLTFPMNSWTSANVNGVVSEDVVVYSPGLRRKKNASVIICALANKGGEFDEAATDTMCLSAANGMGLTRRAGGSWRLYAASMRCRRKSIPLDEVKRGSGAPILASVCPTDRKAPSTVRLRTPLPCGAISPERYRTAKTWRIAIGSLILESRGSKANL